MTLLFSPVSLNPSSFLIWKPQNDVRSRPQVGIRQQLDISPKVHKTEIRNGNVIMSWLFAKRMLKTYNTRCTYFSKESKSFISNNDIEDDDNERHTIKTLCHFLLPGVPYSPQCMFST